MDIKKQAEELIEKVKSDKNFAAKFQENPVKAVESVISVNLPDSQVQTIVDSVKAKVSLDKLSGVLGSDGKPDLGKLGSLLGKK